MVSPKVAFFVHYMHPIILSPSIVNSAWMWRRNGDEVDIYKCQADSEGLNIGGITIIPNQCCQTLNPLRRLVSVVQFIIRAYTQSRKKQYKYLIGFDSYGLIIAGVLSKILHLPLIYFSLELLTPIDYRLKKRFRVMHRLHFLIIKSLEKYFHRKAVLTIIQDRTRAELLSLVNGIALKEDNTIFVPNSPIAEEDNSGLTLNKSFRKRLALSREETVIIYAGQISPATGIINIVKDIGSWPPGSALVIHGFGEREYVEELKKAIKRSQNIILSQNIYGKAEYDLLVQSADIGLIWRIDKENPTSYYMGAASGKMFQYLRYGLPIITNQLPGLTEIVEEYQCGIWVNTEKEVPAAIEQILSNYKYYQDNALHCFNEHEFSRNYQKVIDYCHNKIEKKIAK